MDHIIIENLVIFAGHGVFPEERALGQKFVLSGKLYVDLHPAGISDDLHKTVDYGKICNWITEFTKAHPCKLIEAAVEQIASGILIQYPIINKVSLTLKKPWAPIGLPVDCAGVSITRCRHTVYLSIGSNVGDKNHFLDFALEELDKDEKINVTKVSDYIVTEPYGYTNQDKFLNAAVEIKTIYSPDELLRKIHKIEQEAGRVREIHWGPRTLDIDIILYDELVMNTPELTIPHIEAAKRLFVLEPLNQIAPYVYHPIKKKYIFELYDQISNMKG